MRAILLAGVLLAGMGAAWGDEPIPTENDGPVQTEPPNPAPADCHRCVQGPDGGWSDSNYNNPKGDYYTAAGDLTCCAPGMSQDWADLTGPYFDPGNAPHPPINGKLARARAADGGRTSPASRMGGNGGGHDR